MSLNVFWDNSNIWLVGRNVVSAQRDPGREATFRISFTNLFEVVVDGREVEYAFVGGSLPPNNDALWAKFEALGANVEKQERGAIGGGEVAVDQAIQFSMANRIIDAEEPGTMVLLTGDGSGFQDGKGFIAQLQRAVKKGWQIEVVSWDGGCNRYLRQFAEQHGRYVSLEPFYDRITFHAQSKAPANH